MLNPLRSRPKLASRLANRQQGTAYVRLDLLWDTEYEGRFNRVKIDAKNGIGSDLIYTISFTQQSQSGQTRNPGTVASIITTSGEVVPSEVTHYKDQTVLAMGDHLDTDGSVARNPDSIEVSAVVTQEGSNRQPFTPGALVVHYPIFNSNKRENLDEEDFERSVRQKYGMQVDFVRAGAGYNMRVRKPTITTDRATDVRVMLQEETGINYAETKIVYIAEGSGEVPARR